MAARNPPLWLQAGSHPATNDRLLLEALMAPPPAVVSGAGYGIVAPGDLAVTQNGTPNMSVNVAAGKAFVDGTENANQGAYLCVNDATVNVAVAASDPTNPRKDLVVARVQDAEWSGATNSWSLAVVTGTPAASPSEPAVPANAHVLAMINVAAGATSITNANITDRRRRAHALGGTVVCTSTTRPTTGLYEGLVIYETDTDQVHVWSGSAWEHVASTGAWPTWSPTLTQSGSVTFTTSRATYSRGPGRRIEAMCLLSITGAGSSGSAIVLGGLPVAAASGNGILGVFRYFDAGNTIYAGTAFGASTTSVQFQVSGNGNAMGVNPTFGAANGDSLWAMVSYEAAS